MASKILGSFVKPFAENEKIAIFSILALALALRLVDFGSYLPFFCYLDEQFMVEAALKVVKSGDPNPHYFIYGSFPIYWTAALYYLFLFILWIFSPAGSFKYFIANFSSYDWNGSLYYIGRSTSILFGLGTIYVCYLIGKRLFGGKVGLLSALLLALSPFHLLFSQVFKADISLLLWILLSFYFALRAFAEGGLKHFVYAGVFGGLAMATKYNFFPFVAIVAAGCFRKNTWKAVFDPKVLIAGYVGLMVFFLACPFAILDFKAFVSSLSWQMLGREQSKYFSTTDQFGLNLGIPYLAEILFMLPIYVSPLVYLASLGGMAAGFKKNTVKTVLLLSFPLSYFLFSSAISSRGLPQQLFPLLPFLIIFSSVFFLELIQQKRRSCRYIGLSIFIISVFFYLSNLVVPHFKGVFAAYDEAGRWIDGNIPKDSVVMEYYGGFPTTGGFKFRNEHILPNRLNFDPGVVDKVNPEYLILYRSRDVRPDKKLENYEKFVDYLLVGGSRYSLMKKFELPARIKMVYGIIIPAAKDYGLLVFQRKDDEKEKVENR